MAQNNPQPPQIQIKASDDKLAGSYATGVSITYTPEEFIFDFVNILPNSPTGQLIQLIIMNPQHAKRFSAVFQDLIKKFDNKELALPKPVTSTADHKMGFDLAKE
jgi:hypothetical protein